MNLDIKALQAVLDKDLRNAFQKSRWCSMTNPDEVKEYTFDSQGDEPFYLIKEFISNFMAQFYDKTMANFSDGPQITENGGLYKLKATYKIW